MLGSAGSEAEPSAPHPCPFWPKFGNIGFHDQWVRCRRNAYAVNLRGSKDALTKVSRRETKLAQALAKPPLIAAPQIEQAPLGRRRPSAATRPRPPFNAERLPAERPEWETGRGRRRHRRPRLRCALPPQDPVPIAARLGRLCRQKAGNYKRAERRNDRFHGDPPREVQLRAKHPGRRLLRPGAPRVPARSLRQKAACSGGSVRSRSRAQSRGHGEKRKTSAVPSHFSAYCSKAAAIANRLSRTARSSVVSARTRS